jgi:hypothetical protein
LNYLTHKNNPSIFTVGYLLVIIDDVVVQNRVAMIIAAIRLMLHQKYQTSAVPGEKNSARRFFVLLIPYLNDVSWRV